MNEARYFVRHVGGKVYEISAAEADRYFAQYDPFTRRGSLPMTWTFRLTDGSRVTLDTDSFNAPEEHREPPPSIL